MLFFRDAICNTQDDTKVCASYVSNSSINWFGDTVTGVDGDSHHAPSIKYSVILQESCRTDS